MWHVVASSFGIAAAVLLVGGYMSLQWQHNRHRYELMRAALDRGIAEFPERVPYWLLSLRQGAMILALGVALLIVGGAACYMVRSVQPPTTPAVQSTATLGDREVPLGPKEGVPNAPPLDRPRPPEPNPALERWHQAESQRAVGLSTMGCGFVLVLLGAVRIGFARAEKKYLVSN